MNNGRCVGCCLIVVVDTHEEPILTVRNPAADSPLHDHGDTELQINTYLLIDPTVHG